METNKKKYGKGFWFVTGTDIFERLAYYLGRALILIFVTTSIAEGGLGLSNSTGATMQSILTACAYGLPLFTGVICDRYIGARYTTPVGMLLCAVGYFCGSIAHGPGMVYVMILCVSGGLSLFKIGPLCGRVIADKTQLDSAFSIRYTLVNIGSFIGTFALGILYKDVFAKNGVLGFAPCFRLAAVSMVLGTLWFMFGTRFMGEVGKKPFKFEKTAEELAAEAAEKAKAKEDKKHSELTTPEKKRIGAIVMVAGFSVVFWLFWYLAYLPVYYYWTEHANWMVGGYEVPVTWFDSCNALFCVILGPVMAKVWNKLASRPQGDMSIFRKTGLGIGTLGVSYLFFAALDIMRGDGKISCVWLAVFAFILTLGEMLFSPLGHSFISKYAPSRFLSTMMAVWGFATLIASISYGPLFGLTFEGGFAFKNVCFGVAIVAGVVTAILFILDKRLTALVED